MGWRAWNKMIVVSSSMAAAGVLVCIAALLNTLVRTGSILGYVCWTVALAVAVILVASGYTWVCDKCEDYLSGRLDRLLARGSRKLAADEASEKETPAADDQSIAQPPPAVVVSSRAPGRDAGHRYAEDPRGSNGSPPPLASSARPWRGQ